MSARSIPRRTRLHLVSILTTEPTVAFLVEEKIILKHFRIFRVHHKNPSKFVPTGNSKFFVLGYGIRVDWNSLPEFVWIKIKSYGAQEKWREVTPVTYERDIFPAGGGKASQLFEFGEKLNIHKVKIFMQGSLDGINGKHGITRATMITNNPASAVTVDPIKEHNGPGGSSWKKNMFSNFAKVAKIN